MGVGRGPPGHREAVLDVAAIGTGDGTASDARLADELAGVQPTRLQELELLVDACAQRNEQQATRLAVARRVVRQEFAVGQRAPPQAMPTGFVAIVAVARVAATGVRSQGAALAAWILAVTE